MSNTSIMISILITTYNIEKYIGEALESVLKQNLKYEYEILVGDDGSSDDTINVVNSYSEKTNGLVKLFSIDRDENDKTPAIVRASKNRINLALKASGKYLVFLDGDDYFINPMSLQNKIEILENPKNNDCIMCGSNFNIFYEKTGDCIPAKKHLFRRNKINSFLYWRSGLWLHAEAFVIRNVLDFNSITDEYVNPSFFDDNSIVFSYLKYGKIYILNSIDLNYRQNLNGYNNQDLGKRTFINMLIYSHCSYFINSINQKLRLFSVLNDIYLNRCNIDRELIESLPYYGITTKRTYEYILDWGSKTFKRKISWFILKIMHKLHSIYCFVYFYGFQDLFKT